MQLARRAELETLKIACDGLGAIMLEDAQHKLESVGALQKRLVPLVADVNALRTEISDAEAAHQRA